VIFVNRWLGILLPELLNNRTPGESKFDSPGVVVEAGRLVIGHPVINLIWLGQW
jgi:hypothetical protein